MEVTDLFTNAEAATMELELHGVILKMLYSANININ
jgi:hypothetical protein